ncbi:MAG: hypothetical protein GY745_23350 [Actinomycetia bacterium]|nr:hypothetical protein [Actinomycetes bacterium]
MAAESAAWLHGLSTGAPERNAIALPPGASLPQSLGGFGVVRWRAADLLAGSDTLPLWSVTTLVAFMGAKPQKYRDWPNVSEWLTEGVARQMRRWTRRSASSSEARDRREPPGLFHEILTHRDGLVAAHHEAVRVPVAAASYAAHALPFAETEKAVVEPD